MINAIKLSVGKTITEVWGGWLSEAGSWAGVRGSRELLLMGAELQFKKMKTLLEMEGGDGYPTMLMHLIPF